MISIPTRANPARFGAPGDQVIGKASPGAKQNSAQGAGILMSDAGMFFDN
jgi:hypothetical protein